MSELIVKAVSGESGDVQKRIAETGIDLIEKLLKKNADYGSSAWQVPVLAPSLNVGEAILVRMSDKISRIHSLMQQPAEVNESLEDTIKDLGAYCLLYLARPMDK